MASPKKERSLSEIEEPRFESSNIKEELPVISLREAIDKYSNLVNGLDKIVCELQTSLIPILNNEPRKIGANEAGPYIASEMTNNITCINNALERIINVVYDIKNNVGI